MRKLRSYIFLLLAVCSLAVCAQTDVSFSDVQRWTTAELRSYAGMTIRFTQPVYTCNNYSSLTASLHRVMSPTNQCYPLTAEYNELLTVNGNSCFTLGGMSEYHRMGETIFGLVAQVNSSSSLTFVSCDSIRGTREDMERGYPSVDMSEEGGNVVKHNLLVCAANLEYYLVENLGTGFGPDNASEQTKQHTKVMAALSRIRADIYGFVEIEQGQSALAKIANSLTAATGRNYSYVDDGGSSRGSYTKAGYVYCKDVVEPYGNMLQNNNVVSNRKQMQGFRMKAGGESFIFSLNHFKAKSGTGSGANADQGDGQGIFNADRVKEAQTILSECPKAQSYYSEDDILIMGDLNAYAKEDPITTLINGGMTDLHRFFHADSSYSYTFHGQAGYLDHALCNSSLLSQVTGMSVWHVNSDEHDRYTYDKSSDLTMFRYSDHDPVLVGLCLGSNISRADAQQIQEVKMSWQEGKMHIENAEQGWFLIASPFGCVMCEGRITSEDYVVQEYLPNGLYIINVYANGGVNRVKYYKID